MAKRRSAIGKKGKHSRRSLGTVIEDREKRRKKLFLATAVVVVLLVVILVSAYYFLIYNPQSEKEKEVLTTDTTYRAGDPDEEMVFNFTIYNPDEEPDVFSPLVSGLPSDWIVSLPNTISVEGKESSHEEFSITPSLLTALNRTYPFMLSVTSGNTQHTYTLEYELTIFQAFYGVELLCYNNSHDAEPGRSTYYAVVVTNIGNGEDTINLSYNESQLPDNWSLSFEFDPIDIPGFSSEVVICNITTFSTTPEGIYNITVIATSSNDANASIQLNTSLIKDFDSETVESGDKIQVNYIGTFTDGTIFDTSLEEVATNVNYSKTSDFTIRPTYSPLKVYVGKTDPDTEDQYITVIEGFWEGVIGMKVNETKVVRIPSEKGYQDGKTRIFEITMVSIDN